MRDSTFDVMKGIGIIAMIIGHCAVPILIQDVIFLWHMPLFFIISGFFYKQSPIFSYIKKNIRTLIVPYLITAILLFLIEFLKYYLFGGDFDDVKNSFGGILIASGSYGLPNLGDYFVGAIWFLLALFWCRTIYNIIVEKIPKHIQGIIIITVAVLSNFIGTKLYLPTNILQGMGAMIFFYIGHLFREHEAFKIRPNIYILIMGVLAIVGSLLTSHEDFPLSMVRCYYGYYPVNVIAACFFVYFLYHIVSYMNKSVNINRSLAYLGRISLLILCVHILDLNSEIFHFFNSEFLHMEGFFYRLASTTWHLFIVLFLVMPLSNIGFVRSLFQLQTKVSFSDIRSN